MGELWLVASIGHCGTSWLSQVLNSQPDICCYHELKYRLCKMQWPDLAEREAELGLYAGIFRPYWDQLARDMLTQSIVCDVNSWHPLNVPNSTRVICIVRNGITQLHSLYTQSTMWRTLPLDHYVFSKMIEQYAGPSIYGLDRWERMCALWAGIIEKLDEMHRDNLWIYRFEDLVRGSDLCQIVPGITDEEIKGWQEKDVNRKVIGSREPIEIWTRWMPEMREAFTSLCQAGMERFGYQIPG